MTSTNINIGFSESKNSSRVLKPPGGGHTDIFGIRDGSNEIRTPSKRGNRPQSTINSCFMHEEFNKGNTKNEEKEKENGDSINGNQSEEKTEVADENIEPKDNNENKDDKDGKEEVEEKETVVSSPRVRVPPGGFSSGFW